MLRNKRTCGALCALLCAVFAASMGACAASEQTAAKMPDAPKSTPETFPSVSEAPDITRRFQLESTDYRLAELKAFKAAGAQVLCNNPLAYDLAAAIYQYRDYHNSIIFNTDFSMEEGSSLPSLPPKLLVEIAVSQAPHIDLYADSFDEADDRHPVKAFVNEEIAAGRTVGLLSYGEDARKKAAELFGASIQLPKSEGVSIRYNSELDLYYLPNEGAAMTTDYPVLTSITEQKQNTYLVKAVTVCYWDYLSCWSSTDGKWESSENADMTELRDYLLSDSVPAENTYTIQKGADGLYRLLGFQKG